MLSPWHSWFFQKRRVLRLVDKVLDHEINLGRLREFRAELDDSLDRKRVTVMHNQRSISSKSDRSEESSVGKECVSTCTSRWSPDNSKNTIYDTDTRQH